MSAQGQEIPAQAMIFVQVIVFATMGCIYLALPLAFILFYQSRHVRATCEYKDPAVRWTDRVPLPFLGLSLLLEIGSVSVLGSIGYGGAIPFFGMILKGVPGILVTLALSMVLGYLAWATFQQKMLAWWATVLLYDALSLSTIITFSRVNILEFYEEMQFSEDQLQMMKESGMLEQMNMSVMMGLSFAVLLGFMQWVRKYFVS